MRNQTQAPYFPLGGGLDVVTPALSVNPGRALAMLNFEPWYSGGYRRIAGYERMDGRPSPSAANFIGFDLADATGLSVNDVLTGDSSGATGTVVGISGNSVAVTKVAGTFTQGEDLNAAAYTMAATPALGLRVAPTIALEETFLLAAENLYRADIQVVPGSGDVLGVWQRLGDIYAVRNNAGGTAAVLHRATTSGWTTSGITMADTLFFNMGGGGTGRALPAEGDTVTGGTSGATATVHRVILHAGTVAGNDAEGYLVLTSVAGGPFQNGETLLESATTFANAVGANSTFAFAPGGTYRFINKNFFGGSSTYRVYGCNGVGPGFEIDENRVVSPILHPNTAVGDQPASNVPFLVVEHRNYLWFAFPGGSVQHSVIGEPLVWNGFLGAAEFGIGDELTGMLSAAGGVLVLITERESRGMFGLDDSDFELRLVSEKGGGRLYTSQLLDTVYSLDDLGISSLARTDSFGSFVGSTVSQLVQPLIETLRSLANDSTISRKANQYRLYFSDKSCLVMYVPSPGAANEALGIQTRTRVEFGYLLYPLEIKRIYNSEDAQGMEKTYFASDDGYVYEDQVGKNFDGAEIEFAIRLPFNHARSPSMKKRYRRAEFEISADNPFDVQFSYDLSYGAGSETGEIVQAQVVGGGGFWDVSNWDSFSWDGQLVSTARADLRGSGVNIGFLIYGRSAKVSPWVMQGVTLHFDLRRLRR